MEDQFIHRPVGTPAKLHAEALKLGDDEGSALVGKQLVGGLAPNRERELPIVVLPHDDCHLRG